MNKIAVFILKSLRKIYANVFSVNHFAKLECEQDSDKVSEIIYDVLVDDKPCMIARFGANELSTMINYIGVKTQDRDCIGYVRGRKLPWWWNINHIKGNMFYVAGFYPATIKHSQQFCELMLADMKEVDVLGSWIADEKFVLNDMNAPILVSRSKMDSFWCENTWTRALKNKKVLVVHPFADCIKSQYDNCRTKLFSNPEFLPEFELITLKAVQSNSGNTEYETWFDALEYMKQQVDQIDYDICLIGAGAYGFPLAAHVKRQGKKAVHLGGSLQLFFGIKGKRWENPNYNATYNYAALMNKYWVYPSDSTKPKNVDQVEGACYW